MALSDIQDIETRSEFDALDGVDQDKHDEIQGLINSKSYCYTVHKTRADTKTLLDVNFTFGTDFVLIEDGSCTRVLMEPSQHSGIKQAFFDNGDIFYGEHADYYIRKAELEAL